MKTSLLTLLLAAAVVVSVDAQKLNFGIKAGLNIANQDYESEGISISPDSRTSFHVGGFLTFMFSDKIGLQPELMYSDVGSQWDIIGEEMDVKMQYLSLPVLVRYQPIDLLNIHAGPQFSYRLKAEGGDENMDDDTQDIEVAAAIGAGVDLPIGIGFSARYVLGLTDAFDVEDVTVKNNVVQLSLTYRFGKSE